MTEFAVGDLIKPYRGGIHQVVMIEEDQSPILYYSPIATGVRSKIVHSCSANLCSKWTKEELIKEKNKKIAIISEQFEILLNRV